MTVLAADLGKTNCRVRYRGAEANGLGAPGLAGPGGAARAEAAILAVALPLLRQAGVADLDRAGIAAAGALAAPGAGQELASRLCQSLPARRVMVCSDATAAHSGALSGRPGVVLAVGTGAVALAVGPDGVMHRADGWGSWLGDEGGGSWLGLQGLRAALRHYDGRGPATLLGAVAEARFGPLPGLPALLEGDTGPARLAASFAPVVIEAAEAGDAVAAALVQRAVLALAEAIEAAAARLPGGPIECAVTGGLGPLLMPLLPERLRCVAAEGSPLDGAALLAGGAAALHEPALHRVERTRRQDALDRLATEAVRPGLEDLDLRPPGAIVGLVLAAEREAMDALGRAGPQLAAAADAVARRMQAGGRLFYLGAGTPGRLATLDAAELGPTFSAPPGLVIPLLAGGPAAMVEAVEGAEDDGDAAGQALDAHGLGPGDAVVGVAASGRTPFVVGGLRHARATGALTAAIVNNPGSPAAAEAELAVEILTGAELVAGSTRMSAGTTQKIALNALSTAVMIALGKTYGNRMVDVRASNAKLRRRAVRMVQDITGAAPHAAEVALEAVGYRVKPALVMLIAGVTPAEADCMLDASGGRVRDAIGRKGG